MFVGGTFLAIIAAGIAVGTLSSHDARIRGYGGVLALYVFIWCGYGGFIFLSSFDAGTPLTGMWMILTANLLLAAAMLSSNH
ncbi:hypothetical protein NDR87_32945 [Nocardia sp. CDC159]|uniref:Uncharacterized protein n=1 Tax=Nocardia pulmonis TaxID=2951408 RepID=A0A9X2EGP9_9NOCA|nr:MULTISPECIES: hypothetical protein [Nocardia]MCM6778413.1 hypothetical protein [Nocardia pulmonis]MCM6791191.1 hypothetical protein [Nocardia sp. CDC159]